MSSSQIQALLAPPSADDANHNAILYLNSKFASFDELEDLDTELSQAEKNEAELASNLVASRSALTALIAETQETAQAQVQTAQELSLLRHSLADELEDLTQGLVSSATSEPGSSTLLEDIETLHRNLNELKNIRGYVQVIEHALKLSEAAVRQIESLAPDATISTHSVQTFQELQTFVTETAEACSAVEDNAGGQDLHLVIFLRRIRDKTWIDVKKCLSTPLLAAAEQLHWPMAVDYATAHANERAKFEKAFLRLLDLQRIGERIKATNLDKRTEKDGLYPLEALIQPVALRFKYHFEGTRQTNRPDKPEWYFTHVLNVAHDHRLFMDSIIQQLLTSAGYGSVKAWREFTRLLLPLLSSKLRRTVPSLLPHPSLLAHTIYQALSFDAALTEEGFGLLGTTVTDAEKTEKWAGISEMLLEQKQWFNAWLDGEKRFSEKQYHDIISASDAWQITDDEPEGESAGREIKTTNSARKVKALIEQVTDRYSPLPSFTHRTRFLISIQLPTLEAYLGRISASLDAYETLSSALVRAVPGALGVNLGAKDDTSVNVDTRRLTSGVEGVQRLCKALLSSKYIEVALEGWGEELFFLELWTEINQRAPLRALAQANPALPTPQLHDTEGTQGTIFDKLATQYRKIVGRAEDIIVQQVCAEIESGLKAHLTATTSPNPNMSPKEDEIALSQTLLAPIALLSTHLIYLKASLPQGTLTLLYRRIASRLGEHLLQRQILYRGNITLQEGKAICAECELWVETCHAGLGTALGGGRNRVEAPWLKLLQAGRLIGAEGDARNQIVEATFGGKNEAQWEATMAEITSLNELSREEVGRILRRRDAP